MVNLDKLHSISNPRNKKEYKKFVLRNKYRFFIKLKQDLQLLFYAQLTRMYSQWNKSTNVR